MNCCYVIWSDIIIPLIAALIGGGLTLLGVVLTIKSENKKAKKVTLYITPISKTGTYGKTVKK